ncbi:hypothetical protein LPJ64_001503 [Coemansia asiatica]|uniref:Uncharacterized protein n=1 Tax=Coemansia asiatica TaxID=1052880 RepID=A0A9W8CLF8_9FUNG|nr:hypothetical protein LPJ64_001503 [Coemansia asiatica]
MAIKSEESILRSRLIVEDRPLKRCLRQLSTLCSRFGQLGPDEATASAARVLQEVQWFRHTTRVAVQSQRRCEQELQIYSKQIQNLENEIASSKVEIASLNERLEESRSQKRYRIEYDEIAIEANKRASRQRLQTEIDELINETDQMRQEEASHLGVMESLRSQYAGVRSELKCLADMAATALSVQDLGIILADSGADADLHLSAGLSPATPHPANSSHLELGSPIDDPGLSAHDEDINNNVNVKVNAKVNVNDDGDEDGDCDCDSDCDNNNKNGLATNSRLDIADNSDGDHAEEGAFDNSLKPSDRGLIKIVGESDNEEDGALAAEDSEFSGGITSADEGGIPDSEEEGEYNEEDGDDEEGELLA